MASKLPSSNHNLCDVSLGAGFPLRAFHLYGRTDPSASVPDNAQCVGRRRHPVYPTYTPGMVDRHYALARGAPMRNAWEGGGIPCTPLTHHEWLTDITHWRAERLVRIGYDPARYSLPSLKWAQSNFIQPQMMVHDRYFYDPAQGKYTVDRYLDDLDKRYGGIDSVLVWATYPTMGTTEI